MRFDYTISHVPGKELTSADALSRAPLTTSHDEDKEEEINLYVDSDPNTSFRREIAGDKGSSRVRRGMPTPSTICT